jgi:transcriptional regulator with XRE-family HTH domain
MRTERGRFRGRHKRRLGTRQVVLCTNLRHSARVQDRRQLRTADYDDHARERLGSAIAKARVASGHKRRTTFARAAGVSVRTVAAVERGEPTVGQSSLFAIGRTLPNWTEDTPKTILEGGAVPPTDAPVAAEDAQAVQREEHRRRLEAAYDRGEEALLAEALRIADELRQYRDSEA